MSASTSDKFKKVGAGTVTTLSAPGKALSATSITVGSTTNYPTDTGIVIAIRVVNANGELISGTYTEWSATVASGTSLTIEAVPVYGSDQVYAAGSTTQVFIPTSAEAQNDLIDGILVSHDQDGTHKDNIITQGKLAIKLLAGWATYVASGTRTSATVFTVAEDLTDRVNVGDPVEFTDTTTKYGNVKSLSYSSPNTTVTLAANSDYAVVGNPSAIYFGNRPSPVGFPAGFNIATRQKLFIQGRNAKIVGWDWIQGDGSADNKSETITYGSSFTFSTLPNVGISGIGMLDGTDPTDIGDGNDTGGASKTVWEGRGITTTTFRAAFVKRDGTATTATIRYMYDYTIDGII